MRRIVRARPDSNPCDRAVPAPIPGTEAAFRLALREQPRGIPNDRLIILKMLVAGALVVLFAVLSEVILPHSLSGLLSAAPSIALANLGIAFGATGPVSVQEEALGMIAGGAAMIAYAALTPILVDRWGSLRGSGVTLLAWMATALAGYFVIEAIAP